MTKDKPEIEKTLQNALKRHFGEEYYDIIDEKVDLPIPLLKAFKKQSIAVNFGSSMIVTLTAILFTSLQSIPNLISSFLRIILNNPDLDWVGPIVGIITLVVSAIFLYVLIDNVMNTFTKKDDINYLISLIVNYRESTEEEKEEILKYLSSKKYKE